jgi:hypothetical protein
MSLDYFVSFVTIPFGQLITAAVIVGISYDTVLIFAGVLVATTSLLPLLIPGVARLRASDPTSAVRRHVRVVVRTNVQVSGVQGVCQPGFV